MLAAGLAPQQRRPGHGSRRRRSPRPHRGTRRQQQLGHSSLIAQLGDVCRASGRGRAGMPISSQQCIASSASAWLANSPARPEAQPHQAQPWQPGSAACTAHVTPQRTFTTNKRHRAPVTWNSVRFRAVACRTTTSMRCCPSSLRTAAFSGFSPGWSAGRWRRRKKGAWGGRGDAGRAAGWRHSLQLQAAHSGTPRCRAVKHRAHSKGVPACSCCSSLRSCSQPLYARRPHLLRRGAAAAPVPRRALPAGPAGRQS